MLFNNQTSSITGPCMNSLLPQHGAVSVCCWRRWSSDMKGGSK